MGKSTINGNIWQFSIAVLNYQRVSCSPTNGHWGKSTLAGTFFLWEILKSLDEGKMTGKSEIFLSIFPHLNQWNLPNAEQKHPPTLSAKSPAARVAVPAPGPDGDSTDSNDGHISWQNTRQMSTIYMCTYIYIYVYSYMMAQFYAIFYCIDYSYIWIWW